MAEAPTPIAAPARPEPHAPPGVAGAPFWAFLLAFFVVALGTAFGSYLLTRDASRFVTFWPPGGLAVGALLLSERRRWAVLLGTAAVAMGLFNAWNGQPAGMVLGFAVTNALEELVAASLALQLCPGRPDLGKVRHVLVLLAVAPFFASLFSGVLSAALLAATRDLPFLESAAGLWMGTGLGILVMAPLVLAWAQPSPGRPAPGRVVEAALLGVAFALSSWLVFGTWGPSLLRDEFLLLPVATWAALRFGPRGATTVGLGTALVMLWATANDYGPFAHGARAAESGLAAEVYLAVALVTSLVLASVVEERRRGAAALAASERSLRLLGASMDRTLDWTTCFTADGWLVYANETLCRFLGLPRQRVIGQQVWKLFPGSTPEQWRDTFARVQGTGSHSYEGVIAPPGGEPIPVEIHASLVRFDDQDYCVATAHDLRERKAAEEAARMAGVGTLAAGMAHEINNPLAYVLGNLSWMREEVGALRSALRTGAGEPDGKLEQFLQVIRETEEGATRVREVVRDLKLFSRADGEGTGAADVRRVLRGAISLAKNELRHRARLSTEIADVPPVAGDEHRLGQVFLNLIVNAAQSIPEGHADENVVRVSAQTDASGEVVVEVQDSGCGMTAEVRNRIFEPFFTTKPVGSGTGLGLAICHGIVKACGGRIDVESVPGAGSLFRVALPAATAVPGPAPARDAAPAAPRGRILVLDDDPLVGRVIGRILEGHHVVALTSPRDALERLARDTFDLVLCDLMMPEMTGMDFHAQLSQLRPALAETLVFITGGAFTPQAREFLERTPNQRIEKPFEPAALRGAVARALTRARAAAASGG
ncbi:MASE1 domain-containing protein [Anaeromyxobacter paludicola]|uniref:histidine kinase n=1 Tax=Anaeromyxobacter paludicola TaxID=2918171 RepID=A0ABM7XC55_9BACT|nr:MASE1 domain-containing protein [Anaeromyxobacter paludicola]BDG09416.1 hypothetical protein AMPC_25290 [Anaeromyxobacter paludicola]